MIPILKFTQNTSIDVIFNLCPYPMWIFDIENLKFLKVNNEAIRQYGYSKKEFLSMTLSKIRSKEGILKPEIGFDNIQYRDGICKESFFRHKKKDGSILPVVEKSNFITFEKMNAEIVTAIDISKTIEYEKKLQYQTQIFQSISDINTNLVRTSNWHTALDTCFGIICETLKVDRVYFFQSNLKNKTISQKLLRIRNKEESDLQSSDFKNISFSFLQMLMFPLRNGHKFEGRISELTDPSIKGMLQNRKVKSILALPIISNSVFRGFIGLDDCKDERKWGKEEFQLLDALTTNLLHLIAHADSLEEIEDSEQRFKTLVQKGTGMISIIDVDGNYKYVATMHHNVLGFQPEELMGTSFFNYIFTDDILKVREYFQKILKEEQVHIPPYGFIDSKGNLKWLETILTNHRSELTISGIVANTFDVTEQVQNKIKRNLTNSLSKSIGKQGTLKECPLQ
jgi:PAS domain S-box-containing protein